MGDTIENMDIEIEQKNNKIEFLENRTGLPDSEVFEEINKLGLNKRKAGRIMDGLHNALNNHKYPENQKQ